MKSLQHLRKEVKKISRVLHVTQEGSYIQITHSSGHRLLAIARDQLANITVDDLHRMLLMAIDLDGVEVTFEQLGRGNDIDDVAKSMIADTLAKGEVIVGMVSSNPDFVANHAHLITNIGDF